MTDYENPEGIVAREFRCPVCGCTFTSSEAYIHHRGGFSEAVGERGASLVGRTVFESGEGRARVGIVEGMSPCRLSLRVRQISVYTDAYGAVGVSTGYRDWCMEGDSPVVIDPGEAGGVLRDIAVHMVEDTIGAEFDRPLEERCVIHGDTGPFPEVMPEGVPVPEVIDRTYYRCPACKGLYDSRRSYDRHVRGCMLSSEINGIVAGGLPVRIAGGGRPVYGRVLSRGCDPCTVTVFGNVSFSEPGSSRFEVRPSLELFMSRNLAPATREEATAAVAESVMRAVDEGLARLFPSEEVEG